MTTVAGFLDRAWETTATTGTGTVTLSGTAFSTSYQTWVNAGATNGQIYYYLITDSANVEWGVGTFTTSGTTLTRTVTGSIISGASGTTKINLSGAASVACVDQSGSYNAGIVTAIGPTILPQGRLTLSSNTPVMTADVTGATSIFYAPYQGALATVYGGVGWGTYSFSQLTMALDTTNQPLSVVQDLFLYVSSGALAIGAGPSWVNTATVTWTAANPGVVTWTGHGLAEGAPVIFTAVTSTPTNIVSGTIYFVTRSPATNSFSVSTSVANAAAGTSVNTTGSAGVGTQTGTNHTSIRGTGAGTSEIELKNGVWANKNTITLTNGAGAGTSVAADQATYIGSFYTSAAGQTGMSLLPSATSGGTAALMYLYNAYNRVQTSGMCRDNNTNWTTTSSTWHATDSSTTNRAWFLDGLQQSRVVGDYSGPTATNTGAAANPIGMALNSTTASPQVTGNNADATSSDFSQTVTMDQWSPQLGLNYIQAMEATTGGTATFGGSGTSPARQFVALRVRLDM